MPGHGSSSWSFFLQLPGVHDMGRNDTVAGRDGRERCLNSPYVPLSTQPSLCWDCGRAWYQVAVGIYVKCPSQLDSPSGPPRVARCSGADTRTVPCRVV